MKRVEILREGAPNFIGCWFLKDDIFCDNIIEFIEKNKKLHHQGTTGKGVNLDYKKTTDITINPNKLIEPGYEIFKDYFDKLQECYLDYKNQWPFLNKFLDKVNIGSFNVQKYLPSGHFSNLHSERTDIASLHRVFAFMTYLNNVDNGGTTDFEHYRLKIKPEKSKTLIWPAEWTHAHTGSILESGSKYIITGWLHFPA